MEAATSALMLLLAVVVSGPVARISPFPIPLPRVQIALGALIAAGEGLGVMLKPEIFFLLFPRPFSFSTAGVFRRKGCYRTGTSSWNLRLVSSSSR